MGVLVRTLYLKGRAVWASLPMQLLGNVESWGR